MKFVMLECPFGDLLVDPAKVAWIQESAKGVSKIGFIGGAELNTIRGTPVEIAARLNGDDKAHD